MKRRSFIQLFGLGAAAAATSALPTITMAKEPEMVMIEVARVHDTVAYDLIEVDSSVYGDAAYLELLNQMDEKGLPIPVRLLAAAGGVDLDTLIG